MVSFHFYVLFLLTSFAFISCEDEKLWEYTPMSISFVDNVAMICKIRYDLYHKKTALYSHFKELAKVSGCASSPLFFKKSSNTRTLKLDKLLNSMKNDPEYVKHLKPSGFIFHESRVGSTLISNMLASDSRNLVYSESSPPMEALRVAAYATGSSIPTPTSDSNVIKKLKFNSINETRLIEQFQATVQLMGRTVDHDRLFFKFQSAATLKIKLILKAFPDVPWVFVFRNPIETMMSQLDPASSVVGGPCLRTRRAPHPKTRAALNPWRREQGIFGFSTLPTEAWCAAHLNTLCLHALSAYREYGYFKYHQNTIETIDTSINTGKRRERRGLFIDYQGLPGIVPRTILKLFQIPTNAVALESMKAISRIYSKQRLNRMTPEAKKQVMNGDSIDHQISDKITTSKSTSIDSKMENRILQKLQNFAVRKVPMVATKGRNAVSVANLNKMHAGTYKDDSNDKTKRATKEIKLWADRILSKSYINMTSIMIDGFMDLLSSDEKSIGLAYTVADLGISTSSTIKVNWKYLKEFPVIDKLQEKKILI